MKSGKGLVLHAQLPNRESPQFEEAALAHHPNEGRRKRKKMTILVSSTICILEQERRGVVKDDVNHSISKRRKNTLVITMMDPLMKATLRWFPAGRLQDNGLEHLQRLGAAVNHADPT
jgi:hypothetical protein